MGEELKELRGLGRVTEWYYPTVMEKRMSVLQTETVAEMSALLDRDTVCDLFYMECYMAWNRKMLSRRQDVWVISTHTQDKPMVERRQSVSSCRKHRENKGPLTKFSGNLHSLPFDSSFITVRRVRKEAKGIITHDWHYWVFSKVGCDLLGSADLKCPLLTAPYTLPVADTVLPHSPCVYSL